VNFLYEDIVHVLYKIL